MRILTVSLCSIAIAGCMVGPDFKSPAGPQTKRYTEKPLPAKTAGSSKTTGPAKKQILTACVDIPAQWWTLFHSKELNCLICTGMANSPNIQAAKAALLQAQETWRARFGALLLPAIDGNFAATRQRAVVVLPGASQPFLGSSLLASQFYQYTLQGTFTYALDIFGGARRELEAYCAEVDYQRFQLEAAYLTLTSSIVSTTINIASLQAQIEATTALIRSQEETMTIVKKQFDLGSASGADVLTQETQLAQTRALMPALQLSLAKSRDALAVLVGEFPSEMHQPNITLQCLNLPKVLPVSLPSSLVRQRPDIRAQEALLHAASAQVGVATANLFPKLTLNAGYGWTSNKINNLISPQAALWNYGVGILQPIFHGGALLAERRAAIAAYDQACAVYRETVLQAFQNVADSLEAIKNDAIGLQAQQDAENAARKSLKLTENQFRLGGVSYLNLLNAQRQYQEAVIKRIQAQAARYADSAALFQALGGGWWNNNCSGAESRSSRV